MEWLLTQQKTIDVNGFCFHFFYCGRKRLVHNACTKYNYCSEYIMENPGMPNEYQVHHTLPQKYSDLFEGTDINIHDVENLRGFLGIYIR